MSGFDPRLVGLPGWIKQPPPQSLKFVPIGSRKGIVEQFATLTELAEAHGDAANDAPRRVLLPKSQFKRWSMPGGVAGLDADDRDFDTSFERVLRKIFPSGLLMWAPGNEERGMFKGEFDEDARGWLKSEFILSPLAVMSERAEFVMICDEQMRYSVLGAMPDAAGEILNALGGEATVRRTMEEYIVDYGVGFGDEHRTWARANLLNW